MRKLIAAAFVVLVAYLAFWPVPIEPVSWTAPKPPALQGRHAPNERLRAVEWLGRGALQGPEAAAFDPQGRVYAGTADGRILRFDPAKGASFEEVARTGGRPLGLAFGADGKLYIADAKRGLLSLDSSGRLEILATEQGGVPFGFTDDVDVGPDGTVYFTDASSRWPYGQEREDVLEHAGHGRLLAWHPDTRQTELLVSGLNFANGVAVSGDGSYVAVDETGSYRVLRCWLDAGRRGKFEVLIDNLPGLPDNITWSKERRGFWLALYSPRVPALDALADKPWLRKVVYRLPLWVQPQPARHAWALLIDEQGRVQDDLQDASPGAFAPLTSVRERAGVLWLGSMAREGLARIAAPPVE